MGMLGQSCRLFSLRSPGSVIRSRVPATMAKHTEQAIRDFQKQHALEVDGEVGPKVAAEIDRALDALMRPAAPLPQADPTRAPSVADLPATVAQPATFGLLADMVGNNVLGLGDQGSVVIALQRALAKLGYALKGTAYFGGRHPKAAVTDFQEAALLLQVDGEVGAETALAIDQAMIGPPRPMRGAAEVAARRSSAASDAAARSWPGRSLARSRHRPRRPPRGRAVPGNPSQRLRWRRRNNQCPLALAELRERALKCIDR